MARVELIMPKMGESIMEATILNWLKKPGDKIEQDESVLEVATDKVDTEVPSTHAGVLKEVLAKEGEVVKVGKAIAVIETEVNATDTKPSTIEPPKTSVVPVEKVMVSASASNGNGSVHAHATDYKSSSRFYSPLVKNIAKEEQIALAEIFLAQVLKGASPKKTFLVMCSSAS
jgi:2-oxoglutarate dehydrogenase E2 component (dihydrolipoamide succinyltransferase)